MSLSAIVAQFPISLSIQSNLETIHSVIAQASAGDLLLFPEGALSGYSTDVSFLERIDQSLLAASISHLQKESEQRKINIWIGACIKEGDRWFNAAYGFFANGETHIYRKVNLANHERGTF